MSHLAYLSNVSGNDRLPDMPCLFITMTTSAAASVLHLDNPPCGGHICLKLAFLD